MPAKTMTRKAPAAKKAAAKRPASPQKSSPKAAPKAAPDRSAEIAHLQSALRAAQEKVAALEKRPSAPPSADGHQLRELQSRLTTREAELEAARAEAANLRDQVRGLQAPGTDGNLRCPRCGAHMTEYVEGPVKADRCDGCHGIFFDNGEMEAVLDHHDEQRDAGKKGWFASLLGKK